MELRNVSVRTWRESARPSQDLGRPSRLAPTLEDAERGRPGVHAKKQGRGCI